jgi:hypothetical protein
MKRAAEKGTFTFFRLANIHRFSLHIEKGECPLFTACIEKGECPLFTA